MDNQFLYYIPGRTETAGAIQAAGLQYAFDPEQSPSSLHGAGPDGKSGLLLSLCDPTDLKYIPERQVWMPWGNLWVGMYTDQKPSSESLARGLQVMGFVLPMADGFNAHVPTARELPRKITFRPDGESELTPDERYAKLCGDAETVFHHVKRDFGFLEEGEPLVQLSVNQCAELAVEILGVNYRLGKAETTLLKLLDTHTVKRILFLFVDVRSLVEVWEAETDAAKKNEPADTPAGESTPSGGTAS